MQTNTDKQRIYRNDEEKNLRRDPKRDKNNAKEQIRNARKRKHSTREID